MNYVAILLPLALSDPSFTPSLNCSHTALAVCVPITSSVPTTIQHNPTGPICSDFRPRQVYSIFSTNSKHSAASWLIERPRKATN